jgi:acyl carrier protein
MEEQVFYKELTGFLKKRNPELADVQFDEDTHLIKTGILDSFAVTELILFVEDITQKPVRVEGLSANTIKSLRTMYDFFIEDKN